MDIVIYGAQAMAYGVYKALKCLHPDKNIECFLVTNLKGNESNIDGIPVMELQSFAGKKTKEEKKNLLILISTPENVMDEIEENLECEKICNHVRIDSDRWADLMRNFYARKGRIQLLSSYPVGYHKGKLLIYKMVHHKDKVLRTKIKDPEYLHSLQVGAYSGEKCIAEYQDYTGSTISEKNGNYSELTGLYWIWRNQIQQTNDENYYGIAHYRRRLQFTDDDVMRLKDNDIDVVLPYPMPYFPDIEEHHKRYLSEGEWNAVRKALNELQPEYAREFEKVLKQEYLYNYNIVVAKREVLDAYCEWLFPLLFRIEEINDPKGEKIPNRYIGYIGETLETLYFMCNGEKLRIAHTECKFIP